MTVMAPSRPAQRAMKVPRLLAGAADLAAVSLLEHERLHGPLPLPAAQGSARRHSARKLMDLVERSGLTGRGGAGFPTGKKLRSVAAGKGRPVVVANGAEGEPASAKDKLLLSRSPHLVLDGISLAAYAVGADRAFLAIHDEERRLGKSLLAAVKAREAAGIDPVSVEVVGIPSFYDRAIPQRGHRAADLLPATHPRARLCRPADAGQQRRDARPYSPDRPAW
jgi:nucleotide-binding universal stress UspA family protein